MMNRAASIVAVLLCVASFVMSQVTDLQMMSPVTYNWFEVGIESIDDRSWTTLTTKNMAWQKTAAVFISLPDIGGSTYDHPSNRFLAPKLKNIVRNGDNSISFSVKLVQPNNSACLKTWYQPQYLTQKVPITYVVIQHGAYQLSGTQFMIGDGPITRRDSSASATVNNGNAVRVFYPSNCSGVVGTCVHSGSDDTRAAIVQLQTNVNTIDNGKDFFLYVRVRSVLARQVQLVLTPHSSLDSSIFAISTPETVAYMVFDTPLNLLCLEGIVLESHKFNSVTSNAVSVGYSNSFLQPPGLFGSISTVSLVDATVLRQFSNTVNSGNLITQEDQCADEQTIHTAQETAYALVMGEVAGSSSLSCKAYVDIGSDAPTRTPTRSPTSLPSLAPTATPTAVPTPLPSAAPSEVPTTAPTTSPTEFPTIAPTTSPTELPTTAPTTATGSPTVAPTAATPIPSRAPTTAPTRAPTATPTRTPTRNPTQTPTRTPTRTPTLSPTAAPSTPLVEPMDLQTMTSVTHMWMEIGSLFVSDRSWVTVKSKNMAWVKNAVVFVSLPDIGGSTYNDPSNRFVAPKLKNIVRNGDNSVSFDVKLVQPNNTACSKTWYKPKYLSPLPISWLVIEKGYYRINAADFFVDTGPITRANAESSATVNNGNAIRYFYGSNCSGVVGTCTHSGTDETRGAITQLQTSVNTIDNGKDFFLYVRIRVVFARHIQLVLNPHSSSDSSIFTISTPETVAYMVFNTPFSVNCIEGVAFETNKYSPVTSDRISVNYVYTYDYAPGLFGSISTVSLTDATVLRQFSNGVNSGNFITQEDQCFDEQTIHTAQETAYVLVFGSREGVASNVRCQAYNTLATDAPTRAPSTSPTSAPSLLPTAAPSALPTTAPTEAPTTAPSAEPTTSPTVSPTDEPSTSPTPSPTDEPNSDPTLSPTHAPSSAPSTAPSAAPLTGPLDLQTMTSVAHTWFEVAFTSIDDRRWYTVTTQNKDWVKNAVVFVSLPDIGGPTYDDPSNVFLAPKLRNIVRNGDNSVSFDVKLTQANDSACSKEWHVPSFLSEEIKLAWLVIEEGAYSLNGDDVFIGSGPITRADADPVATIENGNAVRLFYPSNCSGVIGTCVHSGSDETRGAITQLQTSVNTIDNGKDFFLYVRIRVVFARHIQLVLNPHSSSDSSIFTISTPETVAYMVFNTPFSVNCIEGVAFETNKYSPVTSDRISVNYVYTYDYAPGLFGSISTVSLTDATVLRQFSNGVNSGNFITQEDQCFDEQTIHTAQETAYVLVIGEVVGSPDDLICYTSFGGDQSSTPSSEAPTIKPTSAPTVNPTSAPSSTPTYAPTEHPTAHPSLFPTAYPTAHPSLSPTANPSAHPTASPTAYPSLFPTAYPTSSPTAHPTHTAAPTTECVNAKIPFKVTKSSRR